MEQDLPQFGEKNAQILAIAYQNQRDAQKTAQETQVTYPILADTDHAIADAYNVYNTLGDGVATPAIFIINPSGEIVWSYIGRTLSDRPSNETILENIP